MSKETDIVIFIVKSFSFEWWWLDNKEVLVVMVRRFSGVPHSYIDKVVYACALSGYLLTLKHISDKRKVMKQMDCHAYLKFKVNVPLFYQMKQLNPKKILWHHTKFYCSETSHWWGFPVQLFSQSGK